MVYSNSGGESSSMGYIGAKVDRRPTRKGESLARSSFSRLLEKNQLVNQKGMIIPKYLSPSAP